MTFVGKEFEAQHRKAFLSVCIDCEYQVLTSASAALAFVTQEKVFPSFQAWADGIDLEEPAPSRVTIMRHTHNIIEKASSLADLLDSFDEHPQEAERFLSSYDDIRSILRGIIKRGNES